jgi:benzoyl-CoA reductase/2-hydroxyglutaryl-CoA dehydratase subunit BcrC/BadD/HgdB
VTAPRSRVEYVREQQRRHGRRALAVLPVHYPKDLLTAFDVLAVELWGPPGPPRGEAAGRLQPYVCAVVRNALAFLAAGRADAVDGVLFPHTCDSLQGLATLVGDFGGWSKKVFVFQHPRAATRQAAQAQALAEMRSLAGELEAWTGRALDPERLAWAVRLHGEIDAVRGALLRHRSRLPMDDVQLYAALRRGEWLWPEDHLEELRGVARQLRPDAAQEGVPVMITGYVPEPGALLEALNRAGAFVAADDYAAIGRRIATGAPAEADPWSALLARYLAHPPCPTQGADQPARMGHLADLAGRAGARGVLVHVQKFCEPELFDVPAIRRTFAERRLPVLVIEGEMERELSGQTLTRLEAFVELLRAEARAA